MAKTSGKGLTY